MWFLALKQMMSRKKQTFFICLGVTFGTAIYIIIAGLQLGMREYITEQLLNNSAHILIQGNENKISSTEIQKQHFKNGEVISWVKKPSGRRSESKLENPHWWFDFLTEQQFVTGFSPRLNVNGIIRRGSLRANVSLNGIIPEHHKVVTSIEDYLIEGRLDNLTNGGRKIILGKSLAEKIGATDGETILVTSGFGETLNFRVAGIIQLGNQQIDETLSFIHLTDAQTINHSPGQVSEISVSINDANLAHNIASKWSLFSKDKIQGWQEANASFMQIINIQDVMRYIITGAILLVAAFGIYNVLTIMINQKKKEIAILRSIGYSPNSILKIFLIQGLTIGTVGSMIGLVLGYFVNLAVSQIELGFAIGKGNHLLVSNDFSIYATAFFSALLSAIIASVIPSLQASKLTPLEIIRANL